VLEKIHFGGKIPPISDQKKYYLDGIKGSALAFYSGVILRLYSFFDKHFTETGIDVEACIVSVLIIKEGRFRRSRIKKNIIWMA